jgi:electron transfer flavoprotein alpha subunit
MAKKVLVLIEHMEGKIAKTSWETVGFAKNLTERYKFGLKAVILGSESKNLANQISKKFDVEVLYIPDKLGNNYSPEVQCDLLSKVIRQESPFLFIMGHTYRTIDFAPKLSTMLDRGFIPNCIDIQFEEGRFLFLRVVFGGKLYQQVALKGAPPYFASLQRGEYRHPGCIDTVLPRVVKLDIRVSDKLVVKRKFLNIINSVKDKIDLSKAEIIVAGGRGLGSKDKLKIILDLATVLGASVGATRPVIDEGWLPKGHQVGTSGQSVAPRLYIACGISGAIQHLIGMNDAECVVAINKDPNAPIFRVADYGIVGDMFGIIPVLIEAVKERRDLFQKQ